MGYTAKELIEQLSKLPEDTLLWWSYAGKSELSDYFVEGCEISDDDFISFANDFQGEWEYLSETLTGTMDNHTKNVYCEGCNLYDYECITDEKARETYCRHCGEETDVLNG
jgi:hypothetical protein